MSRIKQMYPLTYDEGRIVATEIQYDLNQLFTTVNTLTYENMLTPNNEFDWGNNKLINLIDPAGVITDSQDLQVAVTKNFLKNFFNNNFPSGSGNWHLHSNKAALDAIIQAYVDAMVAANDPQTAKPFVTKGGGDLGQNDLDAITGAATPSGTNVFATMADLPTLAGLTMKSIANYSFTDSSNITLPSGSLYAIIDMKWIHNATGVRTEWWGKALLDVAANILNINLMSNDPSLTYKVFQLTTGLIADGATRPFNAPDVEVGTTSKQFYVAYATDKSVINFDTKSGAAGVNTYNIFSAHVLG